MKKVVDKKWLYAAGLLLVVVLAVIIYSAGVPNSGSNFTGALRNVITTASPTPTVTVSPTKSPQPLQVDTTKSIASPAEYPTLKALSSPSTYVNGGKHFNLLNFRITAGKEAMNLTNSGSGGSIVLSIGGFTDMSYSNCSLVQGTSGTDYNTPYYTGIPGNYNVSFKALQPTIPAYQSQDFSFYCDVNGGKNGEYFYGGVWNVLSPTGNYTLGHYSTVDDDKNAYGPKVYIP
jgi:hypothetical protein